MRLYAHAPGRATRQVASDVFMVAWLVLWWLMSRFASNTILGLAEPARQTAAATAKLQEQFRSASQQAAEIPAVGGQLRKPFETASGSLNDVATAANQQIASIEQVALVTGVLVFLVPVAILVANWLPRRLRFVSTANAAQRLIDSDADLNLFALRALANQPMTVLARVSDDPVGAWQRGDSEVVARLAAIELREAGLRPPKG